MSKRFLLLSNTWLSNLLGFDYEIQYKKGVESKVVDSLARLSGIELLELTISSISTDMIDRVKKSYERDLNYLSIMKQLEDSIGPSQFNLTHGIFKRKGKIVVGNDIELRRYILKHFPESAIRGHFRVTDTLKKNWLSYIGRESKGSSIILFRIVKFAKRTMPTMRPHRVYCSRFLYHMQCLPSSPWIPSQGFLNLMVRT